MGRRWGKTVLGGALALATAASGGRVAWIVPSYKNGRPLWRWAETTVGPLKRARKVHTNRTERTIEFAETGGFVAIYSMDNEDSIRGEWFNLVIVDEAAMIAETAWTDAIMPTLADANGDAVLISTPKGRNWFWREFERGRRMDAEAASFHAPSSANPSPQIQRAARLAKERVPERAYRQEWDAEFVDDATAAYSVTWWLDGRNRYDPDDAAYSNRCIARYISWDTGLKDKVTNAYSAATVFELMPDYRTLVRHVWRDRLTFPNLVPEIIGHAGRWNRDGKLYAVVIEDKASGTSAIQTLRQSGPEWLRGLVQEFMPSGDKRQRAEQAGVWCRNDCVWLPRPAESVPWLHVFEQELYEAPDGAFMDQADAFAQGILYLENVIAEGYRARRGVAA